MKSAFVFPGQGSQSVGMLAALGERLPVVRQTFDEASAVLGYDLWQLCQSGPEQDLNATERTQPAMLAAGTAAWRAWTSRGGPAPSMMAGHSLGEFTALVCAGSIDFADAVSLVQFRGRAMQAAVPHGAGAMAAVLGLDDAVVEEACRESARDEVVVAVNYNAPAQVVIAGATAAVARAVESCKARGAKRAVPLPISVPCHSPLMEPAASGLRERLSAIEIRRPQLPVFAYDASFHGGPDAIREALYHQLFSPVRWAAIMAAMIAAGVTQVVEAGPGKVLAGLARRAEGGRNLAILTIDSCESLDAALEAFAKEEA